MAKIAGSPRSSDNLLQVAGFLKQADKLVRERNYSTALEQIAKARAKDPTNSYAEAYEQRVQLLLSALNEKKQARTGPRILDSDAPHSFAQHLESIASLAIQEAQRSASISLQQTLDGQHCESKSGTGGPSPQAAKSEKEAAQNKETQIRQYIQLAENLLNDQRLDEAMNTLAPAILLDPLNDAILKLERQIRDMQEENWMARVRRSRLEALQPQQAQELNEREIQKCILRALDLAQRKEFSEALTVLGQGYLLDPFNASLASCEKTVLTAIAREGSPRAKLQMKDFSAADDEMGASDTRQTILQSLDKAQAYLGEDRFAEALTQVAFALVAFQNQKQLQEGRLDTPQPIQNVKHGMEEAGRDYQSVHRVADVISRQIFDLNDNAKKLARRGEFGAALEELLKASSLVPTDGSLKDLDREIGRSFMEYYRLMRAIETPRPVEVRTPSVFPNTISAGDRGVLQGTQAPHGSSTSISERQSHPPQQSERQLEFKIPSSEGSNDRISQIRGHLVRSLRHLNAMRLVEASVEGEIASLVNSARGDISAFATAVAGLARKAKAQVPLNALSDNYESIRQQAKDLIYALWYEEILNGLDRILDFLPGNDALLKQRGEVEQAFEEFTNSMRGATKLDGLAAESSKRNSAAVRKMKKRSLDQIGLSFPDDLDKRDDVVEDRSHDEAGTTGALPMHNPVRQRATGTSGTAYLGN